MSILITDYRLYLFLTKESEKRLIKCDLTITPRCCVLSIPGSAISKFLCLVVKWMWTVTVGQYNWLWTVVAAIVWARDIASLHVVRPAASHGSQWRRDGYAGTAWRTFSAGLLIDQYSSLTYFFDTFKSVIVSSIYIILI